MDSSARCAHVRAGGSARSRPRLAAGTRGAALRWFVVTKLPPADWPLSFNADAHGAAVDQDEVWTEQHAGARRVFDAELLEKFVLIGLVMVTFSRMLPSVRADVPVTAIAVAAIVLPNTAISEWLVRRGIRWRSVIVQFGATAIVNLAIAAGLPTLLPRVGGRLDAATAIFSLMLLTLLITLYDRYRPIALVRRNRARPASRSTRLAGR